MRTSRSAARSIERLPVGAASRGRREVGVVVIFRIVELMFHG
jgi:hypothetical protein